MLPKLGILAGKGQLPIMIIDACEASGRPYFVIAFEGQTPQQTVADAPHEWVRMGAGAKILKHLNDNGVKDLVLAGAIRRPTMFQLRPDWWGIKFLLKARSYGAGDDGLLQSIIRMLESQEGFRVVSPNDLVADLLAKPGFVSSGQIDLSSYTDDIHAAVSAALLLGQQDKGQAAIARSGHVVALEDERGTDALLRDHAELDMLSRRSGILAKMAKPQQETRVDLPTIGPETITMAAAAGLAGIVIEADRSLIIDRRLVQQKADEAGIFVHVMDLAQSHIAVPQSAPMVFVIAGEPSGDQLGAALIRGLKHAIPNIRLGGVGGERMKHEGLYSLFPMEDLSVMGVAEVLPRLPNILKRIRQTAQAAEASKPDVVVTIDSPDFCFRVAKRLRGKGIPLVHYVAPSVWAWRPGRAKKIAGFLDHLLAILPFEPPYFEAEDLPCTFVGHPIVEQNALGNGRAFRERHAIDPGAQVVAVLPGSRKGEVSRLLPLFLEVIDQLPPSIVPRHFLFPTVENTDAMIRAAMRNVSISVTITNDDEDKLDGLAASDVALAASGTVALELAQAGVPAIIAYRLNKLTAWFARRFVTARFASLVNLLEDRMVTPEYLLEDCTIDNIAPALSALLENPDLRAAQISGYKSALQKLTIAHRDNESAAASAVLRVMRQQRVDGANSGG
ncbi:MAG: lipid-A-disaccharide synthase [Rhodospirillales bacterium]|nr:lipid-A-disaccharide synthase [Rhodospirillales bacterium]MBT4038690.1 lipid-A-disaccharide synthase [Rhodospirillales bacterium]MBT4627787.1 lipid-A-disaccharide synthase [Rhodospirillales bacterium]MBT5350413.1 lipid-A-disaccharide synthase [Rhodospirillales bacterium]MBT5519892.1 lipid-A-disaccharide synthase [Rhodospirillales bacterium]